MSAGVVAAALAGLAVWLAMGDDTRLRALDQPPWWRRLRLPGWVPRLPRAADVRRHEQLMDELPETLELLAACFDAGLPPRLAAERVAEVAPEATAGALRELVRRVGVGVAEADAWAALAETNEWREAGREMSRAVVTGTGASQALRRVAADTRAERRDALTRRARAVGVRSVLPLVCCFLPAFVLVGVLPIIAGLVGDGLLR